MVNRDGMLPEHIPSSDNTLLYYPYAKARKLLQGLSEAGSGNLRDVPATSCSGTRCVSPAIRSSPTSRMLFPS